MVTDPILPELRAMAGGDVIASRVLRVAGLGESAVAERLADLFAVGREPDDRLSGVDGRGEGPADGEGADGRGGARAAGAARRRGRRAPRRPRVQPSRTSRWRRRCCGCSASTRRTLACAESLTGGGVGQRLTSVPGASASFVGSAVVYTHRGEATGARRPDEALAGGTVTAACALAMAEGALAAVRRRRRARAHGCGRTGAARRRAGRHDLARARCRPTARGTHAASSRAASATGSAAGPSRPGSTWSAGSSRACRCRRRRCRRHERAGATEALRRGRAPRGRARGDRRRNGAVARDRSRPSDGPRPDALHLTIAFIGHVDADQVVAIGSAVEAAAAALAPVPTGLTRFGTFPERGGARVLWVGLDDPDGGLRQVGRRRRPPRSRASSRPTGAPTTRTSRSRAPGAPPPFRPAFHDDPVPAARWTVDAMTLFRSHLGARRAARYERLGRWTPAGGAARSSVGCRGERRRDIRGNG